MNSQAVFALVVALLVGIVLVVFGVFLWKGKGLQYIAGNTTKYYADPDSSEQRGLGKTVAVMLFIAAGFALVIGLSIVVGLVA